MPRLNRLIHEPARLRIMASLAALEPGDKVDFVCLRDLLKLTDGNLGAHLAKLEETRYVRIDKTFVDRKPRTFVTATGKGRDAFTEHVAALKEMIADVPEHPRTRQSK